MTSIPDGKYSVVNVVYPQQAAALLSPTGEVVGHTFAGGDTRLLWNVKSYPQLKGTLENEAFSTFVDKEMRGKETSAADAVQWIIIPVGTPGSNQYQIAVDGLAWTPTGSGEDAMIALEPLSPSRTDQRWTFTANA
ncbi:hypothetical protein F5I97DRAFT_1931770 [Phlebopus sp. FC_14]|nr:hypothetical protein F5I97DRAFT_1931770 [Phlebopus sp. FC_14]